MHAEWWAASHSPWAAIWLRRREEVARENAAESPTGRRSPPSAVRIVGSAVVAPYLLGP
jgi:hypothetical protein